MLTSLRKRIGLFGSYAVLGLVCVSLLGLVSASWLSRFVNASMLQRDAAISMQFVQAIVEDIDAGVYDINPQSATDLPTYADFFTETDPARIDAIFDVVFELLSPLPDVVRTSVYAPDGMRIWCTNPRQVGIRNLRNSKLVQALSGQLAVSTDIVIWDMTEAERARVNSPTPVFSEMYMPIWNRQRDRVVGVIELYKLSDDLFDAIAEGQTKVWIGAMVGGLLLYGVLLGIMVRAIRVMEAQREQLVASETLSILGEMASNIAHLIQQPLSNIRSSGTRILESGIYVIEPQGRGILQDLDGLESWLQGLLAFSQPRPDHRGVVSLNTVMRDIAQQSAASLDQQKIQLRVEAPETLPMLHVDELLLRQVLHTVITNAQEAMPQGGSLSIQAIGDDDQHQVRIQVQDTGEGMTPEQLNQAFRPFFTTKRRGLGIGLALAKRVVKRQGGSLDLSSTEGLGTTVTITLPTQGYALEDTDAASSHK